MKDQHNQQPQAKSDPFVSLVLDKEKMAEDVFAPFQLGEDIQDNKNKLLGKELQINQIPSKESPKGDVTPKEKIFINNFDYQILSKKMNDDDNNNNNKNNIKQRRKMRNNRRMVMLLTLLQTTKEI
jgi:hypothetical protein